MCWKDGISLYSYMNTGLIPLFETDCYHRIEALKFVGGAYLLISLKNKKRRIIGRFLQPDPEGILYIGKADNYLKRVIDLRKNLSPEYRSKAHTCGRRYKSIPAIAVEYSFTELYV